MDQQTAGSNDRLTNSTAQSSPPPARSRRRWILWGIVLLVALLILFAVFRPHGATHKHARGAAADGSVQPVAVATAHIGDMPVIFQEIGTVVPVTNVTITPRVNGHIAAVYYQEGQHVHKGDELELIDPRPYEATLEQYRGTLAADIAQLEKARVDNARYQRLIKQNSTSAMTARDQEFTVQQLEGQVEYDRANVRNAELNVMYCHIVAPVEGRVGIRVLDVGNYVTAGQSGGLTILTQMQPISVIFTVPQNQLGEVATHLRESGELTVEAWNSDNTQKLATGTVKALDSQIDTSTGTVRMRGIFPNEDERLFPNQFVNPHLLVTTLHNVLLVPGNALQTGPDGRFVYRVKSDMTVETVPVTVGATDSTNAVIQKGLNDGDRVVTDGVSHLRPGQKVSIPDTSSAAKQTSEAEQQTAGQHRRHHNGQQSSDAPQKTNDPSSPADTGNH
ncbi:efflux RND transporter periplasmic adaptor subunit [Gluconobacter oxydans]|uniref:efflux RND transporter periplasmic adaptor subunit n=1 Tax=Gluconobacter oxydans TaxID=442 RepID=UPI0007839729|nr:efflux RND transporter periplasmic adaptor subunit [Gluconobacter oxydans]KXV12096.1 multidrug transporter [Gluconobacter oxydans]MCP1247810.1 efflux RND transporter periplasmic adaptor subunit [Gluconobacter oxydans]WKE48476.1 efflux RND transporter periplasmic adaptor subunit [Gluconobacter oxydans]